MSFVQRLRMANMFPIRSDLGNARIPVNTGRNDMYDVIEAGKQLALFNDSRMQQPSGMRMVGDGVRGQNVGPQQPLKFGGVIDSGSNPGADILNRSKASAEQTYAGYGQPLNTQDVSGPSRDEIHLEKYFDRKNKEKIADATLANAGQRGWKVANVTDPNDPSKTISMRVNEQTGETQPLDTEGVITRTGSVADIQRRKDDEIRKVKGLELVRSKANEGLSLIDQLVNPDGTLKPDTEWVTGLSANLGTSYTPKGAAAVGKIARLQNQLTLDLIREMKEQSRTGATGFGQLNLRELEVLEQGASMLDKRRMSEEEYAAELGRIKEKLQMILQDAVKSNDQIKPVPSHTNSVTNNDMINNRIRVKNKATGQTGTISANAFNPQKYDRVQ